MWKPILFTVLLIASANVRAGAALTEVEAKWLRAGWPVLLYAKGLNLPIDIIVQPQPTPGAVPFAMGFENGRCKLVLSMRDNPIAESTLRNVSPSRISTVIEAMTAHEVGHCWRYVQGSWHVPPAGFVEVRDTGSQSREHVQQLQVMRATRREEGFADLVGLAWTLEHHPEHYGLVHAWFEQMRHDQPVAGSYHDTRVWVRLAKDSAAFGATGTPFDRAMMLWQKGLLGERAP